MSSPPEGGSQHTAGDEAGNSHISNATRTGWIGVDAVDGWDWNPQGDRLATVGQHAAGVGFIKVWDPTTGKAVRKSSTAEFIDIRYSLDGATLAVLDSSGLAMMLDADTLKPIGKPIRSATRLGISLAPDIRTALLLTPGYANDANFESLTRGWEVVDLDDGTVIKHGAFDFYTAGSPVRRTALMRRSVAERARWRFWISTLASCCARPCQAQPRGGVPVLLERRIPACQRGRRRQRKPGGRGDRELLGTVVAPEQNRVSAEFLADGSTVAITTGSNAVYMWDTRREYAVEFACRLAGRDLTEARWMETFGTVPYSDTRPE